VTSRSPRWRAIRSSSRRECYRMSSPPRLVVLEGDSALDGERLRQLASHWHSGLSQAQFLQREQHLRRHSAWQQPGSYTAFALVPGDGGNEEDAVILASCEAYRMTVAATAGPHGEVTDGLVYGIASVFVPAEHRRRGLAAALLGAVKEHLQATTPHCLGTLLMCEAAEELYTAAGYAAPRPEPPADWALTVAEPGFALHLQPAGKTRLLLPSDVPAVAAELGARIHGVLSGAPPGSWSVVPSPEQLQWPIAREDARRHALGQDIGAAPRVCGATCGRAVAVWAFDVGEHSTPGAASEAALPTLVLRILLFAPSDEDGRLDDDAAVLAAAVQTASEAGCTQALVWDTDGLAPRLWAPQAGAAAGGSSKWQPPEEELAALGVAAEHVSRDCGSKPMANVKAPLHAPGWCFTPRAVWM
jgi:GNAT superfamily N-acetyltransferase